MFSQILISLDGSAVAEQVLPFAHAIAQGLKLPMKLISAIETRGFFEPEQLGRRLDELVEELVQDRESYLTLMTQKLAGVRATWVLEKGNAAEAIIDTAESAPDTLVAMATHGRSGLARWMLGSVAEKVLRGSKNPLLLVNASEKGEKDELPLHSVIVPLDGSERAETALPAALHIGRAMSVELVLARAAEVPATAYYRSDDTQGAEAFIPTYEAVLRAATEEARAYLAGRTAALQGDGFAAVRSVVLNGPPAEEIINLARQTPGSLIAMCTHGRSGLTRWVLGSVAEKVVHHCGAPVLVLRPA